MEGGIAAVLIMFSPSAEGMREELGAALNPEMAVQRGHVLERGGRAQAEAGGDLLLTVAFEETREGLAEPRGYCESNGLHQVADRKLV